jgi:DNA-binding MarR family transcriptional regulator
MIPRLEFCGVDHDGHSPFPAEFLLGALRQLGRRELTFTQLVAMDYIVRRSEPTIREVAEAIDRSPAATSRLIDDLVRAGLVARISSEDDRRVKHVHLTTAAKDFLASLHKAHHERARPRHSH